MLEWILMQTNVATPETVAATAAIARNMLSGGLSSLYSMVAFVIVQACVLDYVNMVMSNITKNK